jgi:integrase
MPPPPRSISQEWKTTTLPAGRHDRADGWGSTIAPFANASTLGAYVRNESGPAVAANDGEAREPRDIPERFTMSIIEPTEPSSHASAALERFMEEQGYSPHARAAAIAAAAEPPPVVANSAASWTEFRSEVIDNQYGPALRAVATRRAIVHCFGELEKIGVKSVADLDVRMIAKLVASRPAAFSPNTVRSLLRGTQAICSHAEILCKGFVSPFQRRPIRTWVRPCKPQGVRHLSRLQVRAIQDVLEQDVRERQGFALWRARRLLALFVLISRTGLRKSEALWSQVQDLDLEQGIIHVVSRKAHRLKTPGSETFVTCPGEALISLRDWLEHRMDAPPGWTRPESPYLFPNTRASSPWTNGPSGHKPLDRLKSVAERAGVEGASFQKLRASCATMMEAAGAGAAQIKRQLRHSNTQVTEDHYMQRDRVEMARAMERFTYGDGKA